MPQSHCPEDIIYVKYMCLLRVRTASSQTRKQRAYIFAKCIFARSSLHAFRAVAKNKRLHAEIISTRHNYLEEQFRECIKPAYYFVEIPTILSFDFIFSILIRTLFDTLYIN